MNRILFLFILSCLTLTPLHVLSFNATESIHFSEEPKNVNDTTYSGNLLAKVTYNKKITLEGYILPAHITLLIEEQLLLKGKGTYIVHYEISENEGKVTRKTIDIQSKVTANLFSSQLTEQNLSDSSLVTEKRLNQSYIDVGLGVGPNYGIMGGKMVLGYKGNGLAIGVGSFDGFVTNSIGLQIKASWFFANLSHGTYGVYESESFGRKKRGLIEGLIIMAGSQLDLFQNKVFAEIGFGYAQGGETKDASGKTLEKIESFTFGLGIGYRIGK